MHRAATLGFAISFLTLLTLEPMAAFGQRVPVPVSSPITPVGPVDVVPEPMPQQPTLWSKWVTPESTAYGTGALVGIIAFNLYLSPLAAAASAGSLRSWLGARVVASTMAATGGVLTTYAYDRWVDRPIDTTYLWSRAGAVAGVGVGSALLATLGYPSSAAFPTFSAAWAANRAFLVGSGLLGESLTYIWLRRDQTAPSP
jgi:hypothetical protein